LGLRNSYSVVEGWPPKTFGVAEGKARPHRWAPEAGYVTFLLDDAKDLEPAMDLIGMSHQHFAAKQNVPRTEHQLK
jgi:hypothetical protein